jgi:RNA polymerase sigma-70 factor (ECF subfamily)
MTDDEILASLSNGNRAAFPLLYQRYASRGLRYAGSLLHNGYDAEEVVQEAFCRLLVPLRQGRVEADRGGFCALYFKTLRNLSLDTLRQRKRRNHLPLDEVEEPRAAAAAEVVDGGEASLRMQQILREALQALPAEHVNVLLLRVHGGLSYDQIAAVQGCSRAQVRTWIYRTRRNLEQALQRQGYLEAQES